MKKICFVSLLAAVLMFAIASVCYAQSAEDMAKGQSPALRYVKADRDVCSTFRESIEIRGDEYVLGIIIDWAANSACQPNYRIGEWYEIGTRRPLWSNPGKIVNKYKDGNRLILETDSWLYKRIIISGYNAQLCTPASGNRMDCHGGYTREQ